jgi:hypothetical protein
MLRYRIWIFDAGSGSHPNEIAMYRTHKTGKRELIVYSSVAELKIFRLHEAENPMAAPG